MAFNFQNGVPKFPAGVKTNSRPAKPGAGASQADGPGDQTGWASSAQPHPLAALPSEDQDLIVQLVLHSGSLKDLAAVFDVSYPTIRNRLDRVIERLRVIIAGRKPDRVGELLAEMVERGEIAPAAASTIREAVRMQHENGNS